jgi:type VII secretion integral membrane protein EccD
MEERTQHRTTMPGRLRFVLGEKSIDVAVPAEAPLGDVLPAVLTQFGADWIEEGAEHEGWVVQRLGELALDEERTSTELNLLDGQALYLRPRAGELAPIDYDDLVDGVGEQIRDHPGAWSPPRTRWMLLTGSGVTLLLGLLVLMTSGTPGLRALLAGGVAVVLLAGAGLWARAVVDPVAATMLAGVAAAYTAVAGWFLVTALDPLASSMVHWVSTGPGALIALSAGLALVADAALLFAGALTAVLLLTVPVFVGVLSSLSAPRTGAIGLVITLIVGMFLPGLAFRLSGLTLPMLPTNSEELREDIDPVPHQVVVDRGRATVGYLRALHIGCGIAQPVLMWMFLPETGIFALILSAVIALLLFLRSKHLNGTVQRWAVLVPAGAAVASCVARLAAGQDGTTRLLSLWFPAVVVGVALLLLSDRLPGKRLRPYWGRAVDILESLTAVAVLPLLLGVMDVYELIRGTSG